MSDAVKPEDKALILDFGGVISRTLFETHALSESALGLAAGTLTWQGPFAPEADALWQAMQADQISERDYWMQRTREVGRLLGEDWTEMQTFVQRARGADVQAVIRPEAVAAIGQAKALGYKLGISMSANLLVVLQKPFKCWLCFDPVTKGRVCDTLAQG